MLPRTAALVIIFALGCSAALIHSGTPANVPEASDCAIRNLAWEYGKKLQPSRGSFKTLYDALQLDGCEVPGPLEQDSWRPPPQPRPSSDTLTLTVDPADGVDDTNLDVPFRTLAAAVAASRNRPEGVPAHVVLRSGVHFLEAPIQLTSADNHLTIRNEDGANAVVSGGVNLTVAWKPSSRCPGCYEADLSGQVQQVLGLRKDGIREIRARFPNFDPEMDSTIDGVRHFHDGSDGWVTGATQWIEQGPGMNGVAPWPPTAPATSFVIRDTDWPSVEWPMSITTNGTVDPDTWTGEGEWGEYWLGAGGTCADRSPPVGYWCAPEAPRKISTPNHPSGIKVSPSLLPNLPFKDPSGAVVHAWRPGHWYTNTYEVGSWTPPSGSNHTTEWEVFPGVNNVAGRVANPGKDQGSVKFLGEFNTTAECFAAANRSTRGPFHSFTFHTPAFGGAFGRHCYGDTSTTWTGDEQALIDSGRGPGVPLTQSTTMMFSRGGTQGGEGVTGGEAWYIENVLEELDMGREWFFEAATSTLIYKPNSTEAPTGAFVATNLKTLFNISGSQQSPARHIAIQGITLRDTVVTYFEPHGLPSGGDWALQQQGAITLRGTENLTIDTCLLTRLDGNAIFIGGYNRNLSIVNNEFSFIGDSAMAAWGDTSDALNENGTVRVPGGYKVGPDGRAGDQPRGSLIAGNIAREIGLWQKQSSLWFQAVTAQTKLQNNIFLNGPRAAFNFNDGFGGGDDISGNLLLNCVRESSDHGPWNSWSRVPYITDIRSGLASIVPATRKIHGNFILATYFSQQAIDTDDGSSYLEVYNNFFAYGDNGLKSDFGGHDNRWHDNVLAYVGNCYNVFSFKGYNDGFFGNQCVFLSGYKSDCNVAAGWEVHDNQVFSASGDTQVCGMSFDKWRAAGHDHGSTLQKWPSDASLIAMGRKVLGM